MVCGKNIRFFVLLLLICIVTFSFIGCSKKEDLIEANEEGFFGRLLYRIDEDEIVIHTLDAYQAEQDIYYHVTYSFFSHITNEWKDRDLVYFGTHWISNHFSFEWEDWGEMEVYRDAYYAAVEKGRHKAFSQEEIQRYVDAYYSSQQQ